MGLKKFCSTTGLLLVGALGTSLSQSSSPPNPPSPSAATQSNSTQPIPTYATGQPLERQSKEGFWGHMNPLARKKWVQRQVEPIRDRTNELDELQAKNANDIKDVDARASAGISKAMSAANTADAHAADAAARANRANSLAVSADGKTTSLHGTVSNLDQYQKVSSLELPFVRGRTALTPSAKNTLDQVATSLASEKGYIVEIQGFSKAGVPASQAMADTVVRYLVTAHQVPIYRIYRTGLGKQVDASDNAETKPLLNGVRISVLHNSLASLQSSVRSDALRPDTISVPPAN